MDIKAGEFVNIDGGKVIVTLLEKSGSRARLEISTAQDVPIMRGSHEKVSDNQNALLAD